MPRAVVSLYINIEKTRNLYSMYDSLNSVKDYLLRELPIGVDFRINDTTENPISSQIQYHMINAVENIITIAAIRIPKKYRGYGYGTKALNLLVNEIGLNTIIFVNAGVLSLEYPESKYTLRNEPGKIVLPVDVIINEQISFWTKRNYIDMSNIFNHPRCNVILMYHNPIGMMLHQGILDMYCTTCHISNSVVSSFYFDTIKLYYSIINKDKNIHLLSDPYINKFSEIALKELKGEWLESVDPETDIWYSKYTGENNIDKEIYDILQTNRKLLTDIAGCEVYVRNESELAVNLHKAIVIDNTERFIDITNGIYDSYEVGEDYYMEMVGYALFEDGVWLFGDWGLTQTNKVIYYNDSFNHDIKGKPLLFVGLFSGVTNNK